LLVDAFLSLANDLQPKQMAVGAVLKKNAQAA